MKGNPKGGKGRCRTSMRTELSFGLNRGASADTLRIEHDGTEKAKRPRNNKGYRAAVALSVLAAAALPPSPAHPQTVKCIQDIQFGSIVSCGTANTVRIDPTGTRSASGCLVVSGPSSRGRCIIKGKFFPVTPMTVSITAPSYNIASGGNKMVVDNFDLNTAAAGPTITVTAFITTVDIGATLNVGASQAAGTYTGAATINVNYQ